MTNATTLSGHMVSSITEGKVVEKEPVVTRGYLSADQTVSSTTWTKLNIDTFEFNVDNAFKDGKFKPNIAGYYSLNGSLAEKCNPVSTHTVCAFKKNNSWSSIGGSTDVEASGKSYSSTVSGFVYLDRK